MRHSIALITVNTLKEFRLFLPGATSQHDAKKFPQFFPENLRFEAVDDGVDGGRAQGESLCPFQSPFNSRALHAVTKNHRCYDNGKPTNNKHCQDVSNGLDRYVLSFALAS